MSMALFTALLAFSAVSVRAAPAVDNVPDILEGNNYHGIHYDNTTDQFFDLYTPKEYNLTDEAAVQAYWSSIPKDVSGNAKRGFYDCTYNGRNAGLKTLGCGTAHAIGGFISATGSSAAGGYINTQLQEAFNTKRDNQAPRALCLNRDGYNACVSWSEYNHSRLQTGAVQAISHFAIKCGESGGSSEVQAIMQDGTVEYICVSNRASGCGSSVCGQ